MTEDDTLMPDYDTLAGWREWAEWASSEKPQGRACFEPTPEAMSEGVLEMVTALQEVSKMRGMCLLGGDSRHTGENPPRMHEEGSNKAYGQAADVADGVFEKVGAPFIDTTPELSITFAGDISQPTEGEVRNAETGEIINTIVRADIVMRVGERTVAELRLNDGTRLTAIVVPA